MEPLSTGALITLCVITAAKLTLSIATRIKKSKCTDSKGRTVEMDFGSEESKESETPRRSRSRSRSNSKKHKRRHHHHHTTTSTD
jgi:hypothetical protein